MDTDKKGMDTDVGLRKASILIRAIRGHPCNQLQAKVQWEPI
jgi:hypothetical protein